MTEEEKNLLSAMNINLVYLISTPDVTEILNKKGIDEVLTSVGQKPVLMLAAETSEEQVHQIETILANPGLYSVVLTQPLGGETGALLYIKLADLGVPIVYLWAYTTGIVGHPKCLGLVLDDGYARGYGAAKMLAEALGGKGNIGMIYWALEFYSTDQRVVGALDAFAEYPDIKIVDKRGFTDPREADDLARAMFLAHPEIEGVWAVWMDPVAYAVSDVAKELGIADRIVIVTTDLGGEAGALRIADDSDPIIGTVDVSCADMGRAAALLGLKYLAGVDIANSFVVASTYPIAKANLEEGFLFSEERPLPDYIKAMLRK
ncbi:MAG: substrate-binding domain-containing protein [Candidatus Bathyarchaeia archaeon]